MPAVFISHGTPMQALRDNVFTRNWAVFGQQVPKPRLIVSLSAHWLTRGGVLFTGSEQPKVIYDMGGFPEELYQVQYPAPGDPAMAQAIADSLDGVAAMKDTRWGFDHGTWVVLKHMFPNADVPVIQMSIDFNRLPREHFELGQQLAYWRQRGVLFVGSGQLVHNLRMMANRIDEPLAFDWAQAFSDTISAWVNERAFDQVCDFQSLGELARMAHPSYDHFMPLLLILGMADRQDSLHWFNDCIVGGSIDMGSLVVGADIDFEAAPG